MALCCQPFEVACEGAPGFLIQLLKNERLTAADREALQEILRESSAEGPRRSRPRSTPPAASEENS